MPNIPGSKIPELRLHRPTGQAVVRLVNPRGGRRDYYLGKHGSEDSQRRYQQLVARWIGGNRELPDVRVPVAGEMPHTLRELTERFLAWARTYYCRPDCTVSGEVQNLERSCHLLCEQFGDVHPEEFTPNKLRAFRDALIGRRYHPKKDKDGRIVEGPHLRLRAAAGSAASPACPGAGHLEKTERMCVSDTPSFAPSPVTEAWRETPRRATSGNGKNRAVGNT
jgi:hypothetical protein